MTVSGRIERQVAQESRTCGTGPGLGTFLRRVGALALLLCLLTSLWVSPAQALTYPDSIPAERALLVDQETGLILFEKNIHEKAFPASLTKIITTLIVLENGNLDDEVTASALAVSNMDPQGSTQNILEGETMTLRDLLYCIMVASANEACNIVAEHIAGSVEAFVEMMNQKAQALGCENTHFTNTHGLHDDNHYTTAYDMYLFTKAALELPEFVEICNTAAKSIPPTNKTDKERVLYSTNYLISNHREAKYIYYPARGVKTGFTTPAGHCLVSTAQQGALSFVSVVMGAPVDEDGTIHSFSDTKTLFEWGFENFESRVILETKEQIREVKVLMGKDKEAVLLHPETEIRALIPKDLNLEDIQRQVYIADEENITAPIVKGQKMGEINLYLDERDFGTVPLVASFDVPLDETANVANEVKNFVSQPWFRYTLIGIGVLMGGYIVFTILHNARRRRARASRNYRGSRRRRRR